MNRFNNYWKKGGQFRPIRIQYKIMTLHPRLTVNVFGRPIHSFHFFGVVGFILGSVLGVVLGELTGLDRAVILVMSLAGATTFFLLTMLFKIFTGKEKIVYYHHEIAILLVCSLVLAIWHKPILPYIDITLLGIATFLAFGRIGCFSVGCCHGKPGKIGVIYSHDHVKEGFPYYYKGIKIFPVQLVESSFVFIVVAGGTILISNGAAPGTVLTVYTVLYGAFRFIIEFFRGDHERAYFRGLSEAQWTTLLLIAISVVFAFTGVVPYYEWHMVVAFLLLGFSFYLVGRYDMREKLISARHVKQIAIGLHRLNYSNLEKYDLEHLPNGDIDTFQTDYGLIMSGGLLSTDGFIMRHYTLSCKNDSQLTFPLVQKLAVVIKQLENHPPGFEIAEKESGVFHILFKVSPASSAFFS